MTNQAYQLARADADINRMLTIFERTSR